MGASGSATPVAAAASGSKVLVQTRVIIPALRTLQQLLTQSCLDDLQAPKSTFAVELVKQTRLRCVKSTDAVRIMEGVGGSSRGCLCRMD